MGMPDTVVGVLLRCPGCGEYAHDAQTKDLSCLGYTYQALLLDWETSKVFGRSFRSKLHVFPRFPLDKSANVWANQAEEMEAAATIPEEYQGKLVAVDCCTICKKCSKYFEVRLPVVNNMLRQRNEPLV